MVVLQPAHLQSRAGIVFFNTKLCCKPSLPVEYAGIIMDQPDKHHTSDRRLRPRSKTTCPRCKRILGTHAKCSCKTQETKLPAKAATKPQDTGQSLLGENPALRQPAADLETQSFELTEDEEQHSEVPQSWPSTSRSSQWTESTYRFSDTDTSFRLSDTESQASTSHSLPINETPKRKIVNVPRKLLPGKTASHLKGFTLVSKNSSRCQSAGKHVLSKGQKIPTKSAEGSKVAVKSKGALKGNVAGPSDVYKSASSVKGFITVPNFIPYKSPVKVPVSKGTSSLKGTAMLKSSGVTKSIKEEKQADFRPLPETEEPSAEFSGAAENIPLKVESAGPSHGTPEGSNPVSSHRGRHTCPECGKSFVSPGKLNQHMYVHTGERPFQCTQCLKAFSSKFKLVRHNLIHSTERRFICSQCNRQFHRKDHLQNHSKIHSAVKVMFVCDRDGCNKEYGSANSARKHSAAHSAQDGNLECILCGRAFNTTPEVLHHLKIHAGSRAVKTPADRKFRCDHCDRKFFTRKDVRRHLVVHTGLRDFLCQFCPQRFGRKDHLVRHIKKSHQGGRAKIKKKSQKRVAAPRPVVEPKPNPEFILSYPSTSSDVKTEESFDLLKPAETSTALLPMYPPPPYPKQEDLTYYAIDPEIQKLFTAETDNGNLLMHIMDSVDMSSANQGESLLASAVEESPLELTTLTTELLAPQIQNLDSGSLELSQSLDISPELLTTTQIQSGSTIPCDPELCDVPSLTSELLVPSTRDAALGSVIDTLSREESDNAPLPRFNQAFPQPPQ